MDPRDPGEPRIVCLGGATLDRTYQAAAPLRPGTSNPAIARRGFGGVARNVAENLARLGVPVGLVSIVGDDEAGCALVRHLQAAGVDTSRIIVSPAHRTAEYVAALEPDGSLALGLADMAVFDAITVADLDRLRPHLAAAAWVFADCNLPAPVLEALAADRRDDARFRLAVDAVSAAKARRLPADLAGIDLLVLNLDEAEACLGWPPRAASPGAAAEALRRRGAAAVLLTRGRDGLVVAEAAGTSALPAVPATPVDVTGAGDALIAATLARLLSLISGKWPPALGKNDAKTMDSKRAFVGQATKARSAGDWLVEAARIGTLAAALTIESQSSVRPDLSLRLLEAAAPRLAPRGPARADQDIARHDQAAP